MTFEKIKYNRISKFIYLVLGASIIALGSILKLFRYSNMSLWDIEGFGKMNTPNLLIGIVIFLFGIYLRYRHNSITFSDSHLIINSKAIDYSKVTHASISKLTSTIHTSEGDFDIVNLFVKNKGAIKINLDKLNISQNNKKEYSGIIFLFLIVPLLAVMTLPVLNPSFYKSIVSVLPLTKIKTTQIGGTIDIKATISTDSKEKWSPLVSLYGGLKEYPNIRFNYASNDFLTNTNVNLQELSSKEMENGRKVYRIDEGTKVNIKIRKKDFKKLTSYMLSPDYKNMDTKIFDIRRHIQFYELSINNKIIVGKENIE